MVFTRLLICIFIVFPAVTFSQSVTDSLPKKGDSVLLKSDDSLRIKNLNPYFTIHVDSIINYKFEINKEPTLYYWYLKNSPLGLKINKDNGLITLKADKSYFLSGKLKYDFEYKVKMAVQNLNNPKDRVDTFFTVVFYNPEVIPSRVKPTVNGILNIEEGDTVSFKIQCEEGSFPIEKLSFLSNYPIKSLSPFSKCGDDFTWVAPYDFIKESDAEKQKTLIIIFIGVNKFFNKDTATIKINVKETINYPHRVLEYEKMKADVEAYIVQLKSTFRILDRKIRANKNTRTTFDLTSASTALGGTVFSSLPNQGEQTAGKILPSIGLALVPVKEAVAPGKSYEQNSASLVRSNIKRLQYLLTDNSLIGEKDPDILVKTKKLKDEFKQVQLQLIDVPVVEDGTNTKELDTYFNDPKVNKKYRLKGK
ncbi:MAG: hypothetical protein NVSMB45_02000 [Ginsengibacter sp.]